VPQQQQVDGVLQYLQHHGQSLESLSLYGAHGLGRIDLTLQQLPPNLRISSLKLEALELQLGPWPPSWVVPWSDPSERNDFPGMLGNAWTSGLKQLKLSDCGLNDAYQGLASMLPAGNAPGELTLVFLGGGGTRGADSHRLATYCVFRRAGLPGARGRASPLRSA
jgi:hypothetical protein